MKRILITILFVISKSGIQPDVNFIQLGDIYYKQKKYHTSLLFYESYIATSKIRETEVKSKLILNYIRLKENYINYNYLGNQDLFFVSDNEFSYNYISIYGAFRMGFQSLAFPHFKKILNSKISEEKKDYAKLLFGSLYLEEDYLNAKSYYQNLYNESKNDEVKRISYQIIEEIQNFTDQFSNKNPWIAASFSAIFPGAGYLYTKHNIDALFSFFWNFTFLGGGIYMYNLEKQSQKSHMISSTFITLGLIFYITNIVGSYTSAIRYNNYQIKVFHQKLRKIYFNTDFIENTSGIEFYTKF